MPESGLALYTDDPTDTLAVRIATLDEPLLIAVGDTPQEQAFALWVHQQLVRKGVSARFAVADAEANVVQGRTVSPHCRWTRPAAWSCPGRKASTACCATASRCRRLTVLPLAGR